MMIIDITIYQLFVEVWAPCWMMPYSVTLTLGDMGGKVLAFSFKRLGK